MALASPVADSRCPKSIVAGDRGCIAAVVLAIGFIMGLGPGVKFRPDLAEFMAVDHGSH